jgi:hypothetical protein
MNAMNDDAVCGRYREGKSEMWSRHLSINLGLAVALVLCASAALPQTSEPDARQSPGIINGTIVDDTGAAIAGAKVTLWHDGTSPGTEALSRADGQFSFLNVSSGPFRLSVSASGFADQTVSGVLDPGSVSNLPPVRLTLAFGAVAVEVTQTRVELAEQQIKGQEQQRLFGFLPNFGVRAVLEGPAGSCPVRPGRHHRGSSAGAE